MKLSTLIFTFLLYSFSIYPQGEFAPAVEFFFITENAPGTPIINCTLTAQSQCWRSEIIVPPVVGTYYLTNNYNSVSYYPVSNNMGSSSAGFDFITSTGGSGGYPDFAYGVYKVTNNVSNKCFYIDYRDFRIGYYGLYNPSTYGHDIDLWVKYDYELNLFSYSTLPTYGFTSIENNQLLKLWEVKQKGNPLTYLFPSFWENALAVIPTNDNHPKLVWGPYPSSSLSINNYKIYRKYGSSAWSPLATISSNTYDYIDNSVSLTLPGGQAGVDVQYKIVAIYNNNQETLSTNIVTVNVPGQQIEKIDYQPKPNNSKHYSLDQNYPNPFNPETEIRFSIAENSFISLRIYDMIGKEIEVLVNEEKTPGTYSVNFNGLSISSGIYFYKLQANNFTQTRKMILIK